MSWDIVIFNTNQKVKSVEELDETLFEKTDFDSIFAESFENIVENEDHRQIESIEYSIDYFTDSEPVTNKMLSLYGENGLYELIELAKQNGWQIFDTGIGKLIDLNRPEVNGYSNHQRYVSQILKRKE